MKDQLTAVSLFAGVGGFDLALERNGVKVVAAVEIDNNARGVLKHRFPNTELFTDVMEVTGDQLINAGFNPDRGIIVGGFPCQDLSVAGKRAGLEGARSGLFWQICRLLDETKARYFILENVPGLLSSNDGRDMGAVVSALVERGYGVSYRILDAQHFGVAQRRRRVFIVGSLGGHWGTSSEILDLRQGRRGHLEASLQKRQGTSRVASNGTGARRQVVGTLLARDYKGLSTDDLHENKLVIQDETLTFAKSRRAQNPDDFETWVEQDVTPTLNVFDNHTESRATELIVKAVDFYNATLSDTAQTIRSSSATNSNIGGVMETEEADKPVIMRNRESKPGGGKGPMLGDKSFTLATNNDQTVFYGNRVADIRVQDDKVNTLQARMGTGGNNTPMVASSTVRRLTPTECERLQGFPDGWTSERFDYKKNEVIPQADSNRYKQMGNAVAVPVVQWIIARLVEVDGANE